MLGVIDKYIGKILETPNTEQRELLNELSNTRNENKRMLYVSMLKNILELLNVRNKGYTQVFMNQLMTDLQRSESYQLMPITQSETLLLTNVVNDIGYRFNTEEALSKVVKAQSVIRGFLYHKRYTTYKKFSATKFQQYNTSFLNLHEKEIKYVENIQKLLYYLDEMKAQPKFSFLNEYPYKDYYVTLTKVLKHEITFKNALDDIYGTYPKVTGVGEAVKKYLEKINDAYKGIELQGAVIMALVTDEEKHPELKEFSETLSKGQVYAFRYLLQAFPRIQHFGNLVKLITTMKDNSSKLEEYKDEVVPLEECLKKLKEIDEQFHNPLKEKITLTSDKLNVQTQIPEFATLMVKIKKEFTKTPSVVEVFLKLGKEIENVDQKRFLKESKVTVEVLPNIDNYPPNLKTNSQSLTFNKNNENETKKTATTLRPKLQRRTNRQKEEAKLKATGELKMEIEILKNVDLEPTRFEATLFVMNDMIYVAVLDETDKYHVVTEIPLTGHGFSVSNYSGKTFKVGCKTFNFETSFVIPNEQDARNLFLLLREVYYVHSPPKLFGSSLEDILEKEGNTTGIPLCIKAIGDYLMDEKNIKVEGIFRKNGSSNNINRLSHVLDQMPDHFNSFDEYTIYDITSTFKKFFLEMKQPLFSHEVVDKLISIESDDPDEKLNIKKIMKEYMKPMYYKLTEFLIRVVKKSVDNENVTLMNAKAMSVCIGPDVIRSTTDIVVKSKQSIQATETVGKVTRCNDILALIISDCDYFFDGK